MQLLLTANVVLTSREGGIATVWYILRHLWLLVANILRLVATLGSKTNNKKVNRKSILEVNVKKTCDIIIQPEAPMALRLQGNLLYVLSAASKIHKLIHYTHSYGVVRVYSRQSEYVLSDAETTQANMRALLKAVKTSEVDSNAGKAR